MSIQILKNGKVVKSYPCTPSTMQKVFMKAFDIAGGMWNGKDEFLVKVNK